jgi:glycosyltransferase involved in cell wall biosynthesis
MRVSGDASAPWLTVVIPAYGGEEWIDTALGSLAAEAAEGVEVLLIDGSPTPATREKAKKFSGRLRLRIFERPDLSLWQGKTNFGVELAQSNHICLLCVDDVWLAGRTTAVRGWLDAAPEAPLHLAPSAIIDRFGQRLGICRGKATRAKFCCVTRSRISQGCLASMRGSRRGALVYSRLGHLAEARVLRYGLLSQRGHLRLSHTRRLIDHVREPRYCRSNSTDAKRSRPAPDPLRSRRCRRQTRSACFHRRQHCVCIRFLG